MKRKFSFNLAPVKVPSKSDVKATPEPTPSHKSPHYRHQSKDSISSLNSPFICRRPLSPKTEQELRAACALILQDFKPSDHGLADVDPKLDFQGMNRGREREHKSGSSHVKAHRPTGAPSETRSTHDARTQGHSSSKHHTDAHTRANTGRRREHAHATDREHESGRNVKLQYSEPPRSATMRTEEDPDDTKSLGTPLTGSTDAHLNNGSTAPTSAALTSGRSSKRTSRQFENPAAVADAQAAEWMRQELEKRRQQMASQPQPQTDLKSPGRPPSRARSIRSNIKEYVFPGSTTLSRQQSVESINTMNSRSSSQLKRSGSSNGWRSWGLQRKSSSRSSSRPTTSKGRMESSEQEKRNDLDLNRELPPLPSLDSWNKQEPQQQKENRKSQHIATVMRSQDHQQQEYAAAIRKHHRRSGSDTLTLQYANSAHAHSAPQVIRTNAHMTAPATPAAKQTASKANRSMDFEDMMSAMDSPRNIDDQLTLKVNGDAQQQNTNRLSRPPSVKMSSEGHRLGAAPNFSRKISTDVAGPQRTFEPDYQTTVHISGQRDTHKVESKSKLRRAFSSWMLRKEKKGDWMQKIEKNGVKGGVMVQDEAALPPVVRY